MLEFRQNTFQLLGDRMHKSPSQNLHKLEHSHTIYEVIDAYSELGSFLYEEMPFNELYKKLQTKPLALKIYTKLRQLKYSHEYMMSLADEKVLSKSYIVQIDNKTPLQDDDLKHIGWKPFEKRCFKISDEHKEAIRLDAHGTITRPNRKKLKKCRVFHFSPRDTIPYEKLYDVSEYNLSKSEVWKKYFADSPRFRNIQKKLEATMQKYNIHPEKMDKVSYNDINNLMYITFAKNKQNHAVIFEGAVVNRVKTIMTHPENVNAINQYLEAKGLPPEEIAHTITELRQGKTGEHFDVHHIHAVNDAGERTNYFGVENPENLILVPKEIHRAIHSRDKITGHQTYQKTLVPRGDVLLSFTQMWRTPLHRHPAKGHLIVANNQNISNMATTVMIPKSQKTDSIVKAQAYATRQHQKSGRNN